MTAMLCNLISRQHWLNALLACSALVGVGLATAGALAQTIPDGTNLYPTYTGPATSSTVWNLLGDAYVSNGTSASVAVSLPSGLTIDGAAGGSTITMNDGANHFAYFNFATDVTLNLNDVTFTGGGASRVMEGNGHDIVLNGTGTLGFINNSGPIGGVIHTAGSVTLDASVITLANNSSSSTGGVIWSGQDITIGNADSIVTIDGNRANIGGALKTDGNPATGLGATKIDGRVIAITNNSSATFAGAIYAGGDPSGGGVAGGLSIGNANSVVTITGNSAQTSSVGAFQVRGPLMIDGTKITIANNSAATFAGAIYTAGDTSIGNASSIVTITGNRAQASSAGAIYGGGGVTINGSQINLADNSAATFGGAIYTVTRGAVSIGNADSIVTLTNNSAGTGAGAIYGDDAVTIRGSQITIANNTATTSYAGAIYTSLASAADISIGDVGSIVAITGNKAGTSGGALRSAAGGVRINGSDITASDNHAGTDGGAIYAGVGVTIGNAGSVLTLTGNSAGGNGGGIYAGGNVTLMGTTISNNTAVGNGGAIYALGDFNLTSTMADTISNNSAGGNGGAFWVGGNITLNATAGNMTFSGNSQGTGANAIYMNNTGGSAVLALNTNGNTITFFDPIASNAANGLLNVLAAGSGAVVFDGSQYGNAADRWSEVYGTTEVQGGVFAVQNNSVYGVLAADVGEADPTSFTVAPGAILSGGIAGEVRADNFALNGTLDISGSTALGHPTGSAAGGFSTFTITSSNVNFASGSRILFNTYLNDASTQLSDLLVLNLNGSSTTGMATVLVTNAGGLGALTIGDGIKLVQTNDGSSAGAFTLGNRVAAGAYEYGLFYNGVGTDAADGNWYLRSEEIRVEVPPDVVVPEEAGRLGLAMLGSASNRLGGPGYYGPDQFCADDVTPQQPGLTTKARPVNVACNTLLWGRVFGETGSAGGGVGSNGGFGSAGPAHSFDYGGFEAGADLYRTARDNAGLYAGTASSWSNVNMPNGGPAGTLSMNAYAFGGYWTHRNPVGWYTDLVLQGDWYDNIRARSIDGQVLGTQGWGVTASAEAGYQFALGNGFSVIPQGQIIYQRTSIDGGADQFGQISYAATDEVYGRLGARFAKNWLIYDGRTVITWAETNFWHQFGGDAKTTFSTLDGTNPTTFATSLGGTWAQLRLGVSGLVTRNVSLFANADYNVSLDDQHGHSVGGRAGIRVAW